jgi:uncharacterized protein YraI
MSQHKRTPTLRLTGIAAGLLVCGWAPAALAAVAANVLATVHLRAGPSIEYPTVSLMPAGASVTVFGCEQNYGWCDAQIGPDRGWVDAAYLQIGSPRGPLIVANAGVTLGIPTVSFVFGTYWDTYYRGRPWYARRPYFYNYWNRYPHGRPPPPPRRPIARPPGPGGPPPAVRPPPGPRPPGARPPVSGQPPNGGKPPGNKRPPGNDRSPPNERPPGDGTPPKSGGPSGSQPRPIDPASATLRCAARATIVA